MAKVSWIPQKGQPSMRRYVDNKGRGTLVAQSSRGTVVNHACNVGTPWQEAKTASSGLPDSQKQDI